MSLNRSEQRVYDYFQSQADERHFWISKVQKIARQTLEDRSVAVRLLENELWSSYVERSEVAAPFKEAARVEGLQRTSMKNLAELLVRLWVEPVPKRKPSAA